MAWEVWWALVLGFTLSGIVQAWVPRARLERALGGTGARQVALSAGMGAASSSCSYAAVAIAKSLFQKGASFASAMVFQFASTNLVFEIGIVMWIFLGWQFTLAEFVGGIVIIALMWLGVRTGLFLEPPRDEQPHGEPHERDQDDAADELGERELPAQKEPQHEAELEHEVRGGELERHGGREARALLEQRLRDRDRRVGARRRGRAEPGRK